MSLTKERHGIEVATPEHDKLMAISDERRETAQEFYDWLHAQGWLIAEYPMLQRWVEDGNGERLETYRGHELREVRVSPTNMMGMFLGVDAKKISDEKDAIVRALQARHREDQS